MNKASELFKKIIVDGTEIDLQQLDENNGKYNIGEQKTNVKINFIFKNNEEIPEKLFTNTNIKKITLPESFKSIGNKAFTNTNAQIFGLENVEVIGESTLYGTVIPDEIKEELMSRNPQALLLKVEDYALRYDKDSLEITSDEYTLPVLTNTHNLDVVLSSSNTDVATIENNEIVIGVNGTTTITASFAGNDTYMPKSVSYQLIVNIPEIITYKYYLGETEQTKFVEDDINIETNEKPTELQLHASAGDVVSIWIYPAEWGKPQSIVDENGNNATNMWVAEDWLTIPENYIGGVTQVSSDSKFTLTW